MTTYHIKIYINNNEYTDYVCNDLIACYVRLMIVFRVVFHKCVYVSYDYFEKCMNDNGVFIFDLTNLTGILENTKITIKVEKIEKNLNNWYKIMYICG